MSLTIGGLGTLGSLRTDGGLIHRLKWILSWHAAIVNVILSGLQVDKAIALVP